MSFFDKITAAAEQAKKALDDVSEALDTGSDSGATAKPTAASGSTGKEASATSTGDAPLTLDEVREVSGVDFDHFYDGDVTDEWASRTFNFSDGSDSRYFELRTAKVPSGEEFDAEGMWDFVRTEVSPQEPVESVAPGAFRSASDSIFFRVGDRVMHTAANLPHDTIPLVEALAKRAAANARSL